MGWLDEIARYPASQMSPAPQPGGILPTPTPTPPNFGKMILNPVTIGALLLSAIPAVRRAQKIDPTMLLAKGYLQRLQAYRDAQREWQREKQQREWWMQQQKYKEGVSERERQQEETRAKNQAQLSAHFLRSLKSGKTDWVTFGQMDPEVQARWIPVLTKSGKVSVHWFTDKKNNEVGVLLDPQGNVVGRINVGEVKPSKGESAVSRWAWRTATQEWKDKHATEMHPPPAPQSWVLERAKELDRIRKTGQIPSPVSAPTPQPGKAPSNAKGYYDLTDKYPIEAH